MTIQFKFRILATCHNGLYYTPGKAILLPAGLASSLVISSACTSLQEQLVHEKVKGLLRKVMASNMTNAPFNVDFSYEQKFQGWLSW